MKKMLLTAITAGVALMIVTQANAQHRGPPGGHESWGGARSGWGGGHGSWVGRGGWSGRDWGWGFGLGLAYPYYAWPYYPYYYGYYPDYYSYPYGYYNYYYPDYYPNYYGSGYTQNNYYSAPQYAPQNYTLPANPTYEDLGRAWGTGLRQGYYAWDGFSKYVKDYIVSAPLEQRDRFRQGFAAGYGADGLAAYDNAYQKVVQQMAPAQNFMPPPPPPPGK